MSVAIVDVVFRKEDILKTSSNSLTLDHTSSATAKTLETLFLASNQLRLNSEEVVEGLRAFSRVYGALEHILLKTKALIIHP